MRDLLLNKIVPELLYALISFVLGIIAYYIRSFFVSHKNFLELQREQLIQKIGIDTYNKDVAVIQNAVYAAEQLGKELDWESTVKHSKVLELVGGKVGLSTEEIYSIIKATVGMLNAGKVNAAQ